MLLTEEEAKEKLCPHLTRTHDYRLVVCAQMSGIKVHGVAVG